MSVHLLCGLLTLIASPSASTTQVSPIAQAAAPASYSPLEWRIHPIARQLATYERFYATAWPAGDRAAVENVITDGVTAYLVKSGQVSSYPVAELPPSLTHGTGWGFSHDVARRRGYYRLDAIQPDAPIAEADTAFVQFVAHENFHAFVQGNNWPEVTRLLAEGSRRVQAYPVVAEPRAYREEIGKRLLDALTTPDTPRRGRLLAEAAGLYQGWKTRFPEEVRLSQWTDIIEGSATYFEVRVGLMTQGADGNASVLAWYLSEWLPSARLDLTTEAYRLGALAGLLLDQEEDPLGWKGRLMAGVTPLELLLGGRTPRETVPSGAALGQAQEAADRLNASLAPWLEPVLKHLRAGAPLLVIEGRPQGSFGLKGFYRHAAFPEYILIPITRATVATQQGAVTIGDAVWLERQDAGPSMAFVIEPDWVVAQSGKLVVTHPGLSRPLEVTRETDAQGRTIYRARSPRL
ncbi:hypothetical protein [Deinococcus sp. YIM 77859]|uniref:hypothetical protein n=1 Tax=Deinococcus sp. YIM 77859 TaxID=1540221 RepID=UPI0012E0191A|nr:hypothetical protein [Deinococcus sp. YIM 77859]